MGVLRVVCGGSKKEKWSVLSVGGGKASRAVVLKDELSLEK